MASAADRGRLDWAARHGRRPSAGRLGQAAAKPPGSEGWPEPWVQLKYFTTAPAVFPRFIGAVSDRTRPGDLVTAVDKEGRPFAMGFFNPTARIPLRLLQAGEPPAREEAVDALLDRAIALRRRVLRLDETGDAWRAVHSDADGLGGLVVDKFADVLSVEVSNLGVWKRLDRWLPRLHEGLETRRAVFQVDPDIARIEGIDPRTAPAVATVRQVRVTEHGVRYIVDFADGHKTGFFCDQRDNRRRFAQWTAGRRVLDLCCYTGGFAISAKAAGSAAEVTGVDLDEKAIVQARANANLNHARVRWVHADAFDYARQMLANGELFGAVVLDPPKFVNSRDDQDLARRKYNDLNALGVCLVERGGLFVTCSCSGLLSPEDFEHLVIGAAHRHGRRLQILDRTEAGPDHPVMSHCPESRYLKALWALVW
ncbi:MAG: class I SAM-dependent rRNA methyltransferase [Verrucomicrobiales bacterium]